MGKRKGGEGENKGKGRLRHGLGDRRPWYDAKTDTRTRDSKNLSRP